MANRAGVDAVVHMPVKWGWLLALGIVLIVVGTFSVVVSVVATLATVLLFGWLLLFTGAMEGVYAFHQSKWSGILLHVVNGVLAVVAGFLLVTNPAAGALVLTLLMAMFFMIGGLFRIFTPIVMHLPHRGWLLLSGIVTLLLGIFHLATAARRGRLGDRNARRDRHDLHRLVVGDAGRGREEPLARGRRGGRPCAIHC